MQVGVENCASVCSTFEGHLAYKTGSRFFVTLSHCFSYIFLQKMFFLLLSLSHYPPTTMSVGGLRQLMPLTSM